MKRTIATLVLLFAVIFSALTQQAPRVTYTHNFPDEIQGEAKELFIKRFEKGRILYQINCAKCHSTKKDGEELLPVFTREALSNYELRIMNPDHSEEMSETRVNVTELYDISLFLTYNKKVVAEAKK